MSIPKTGKRLIERAARRRHQTISEFMRAAVLAEVERVIGPEPERSIAPESEQVPTKQAA